MPPIEPAREWIAVDWGTSRMRARRVGLDGVRGEAEPGPGMAALEPPDYEPALLRAVEPWLPADRPDGAPPVTALVCGMAGARGGWREAPYRPVPARLDGLLAHAVGPPVWDPRLRVRIVPGLAKPGARPDVMRGEETQLLGFLRREGLRDALVIMPGTHSKRVTLRDGAVRDFSTAMTGELHALLRGSTLAPALEDAWDAEAFARGLEEAEAANGAVLPLLFSLRAGLLLGQSAADEGLARLSGLLIGAELLDLAGGEGTVHLIGEGALVERYGDALARLGRDAAIHHGGELAVAGLAAMREERGAAGKGGMGGNGS